MHRRGEYFQGGKGGGAPFCLKTTSQIRSKLFVQIMFISVPRRRFCVRWAISCCKYDMSHTTWTPVWYWTEPQRFALTTLISYEDSLHFKFTDGSREAGTAVDITSQCPTPAQHRLHQTKFCAFRNTAGPSEYPITLKRSHYTRYHRANIQQFYVLPTVCLCFVWIWEQIAIISLYSIKWLVF
jgi:hypothetical protein